MRQPLFLTIHHYYIIHHSISHQLACRAHAGRGVLAVLIIIVEAAGFWHKGVQILVDQRGSQVGRIAVIVQFVEFALNGGVVAGNVVGRIGLVYLVVVHGKAVV